MKNRNNLFALSLSCLLALLLGACVPMEGSLEDVYTEALENSGGNATINAQTPTITDEPASIYCGPDAVVELAVNANVDDGGTVTFQWYRSVENNRSGGEIITGASYRTYEPPTAGIGVVYYWVVVTNTNNKVNGLKTATAYSVIVSVTVSVDAETPKITEQPALTPAGGTYPQQTVVTLSVTASVSDGGLLSYQWYSNNANNSIGGTPVGAGQTYIPGTSAVGTAYYYVVVTNTNNAASGVKIKTETSNVVYVTVVTRVNAQAPSITVEPNDISPNQNAQASLSVTAMVESGGVLSYQWYSNTTKTNSGGTAVPSGGTGSTYLPDTGEVGIKNYYVVVTNTNNSVNGTKTAAATSRAVSVNVQAIVNAATPVITTPPAGNSYVYGGAAIAMTVSASKSDSGTLSYQWYNNGITNSNSGGSEAGSGTSYIPSTYVEGTTYYYVVVTNTNTAVNGAQTATAKSNPVAITVNSIALSVNISSPPGRPLTPIYSASSPAYNELSTTFTVQVSGFLNNSDAYNTGLAISGAAGLTLSGYNATGNAVNNIKTFTVTITYDDYGSRAFSSATQDFEIYNLTNIPAGHAFNGVRRTATVTIYDGQVNYTGAAGTEDRRIPVTSDNIAAFNKYANTTGGLGKHYKLKEPVTLPNAANNWEAIGGAAYGFYGSFDGQTNSITNLRINLAADYQGMFGRINSNGTVKNLSLLNCNVSGRTYAGGIIGMIETYGNFSVENCDVTGTISGSSDVGGIAGLSSGIMKKCYSSATVSGTDNVGGLVGINHYYASIQNCYATGGVSGGNNYAGGLVGFNYADIQYCYSTGNVSGYDCSGGLVGINIGPIQNCYSKSAVSGYDSVGGLVGRNWGGGIEYCYATGTVTGSDTGQGQVAGIAGDGGAAVRNCVALNPSLKCRVNNFARVATFSNNMKNNYARNDMVTTYLANPGWYPDKGLDTKDGQDVQSYIYNYGSFWTTATNWDGAAWDLNTAWQWGDGLPILRSMPAGNQ